MSNKIISINSKKNLQAYPRVYNRKGADKKYFLDTNRPIDSFTRLYASTNVVDMDATATSDNWDGVEFENPLDFAITTVEPAVVNEEGYFEAEYKATGSASTMTEEQRQVYGTATVAGETKFVVVKYNSNFVGAKGRQVFWTKTKDDISEKVGYAGIKDVNGTETTVLGIDGPGTVNNGAQYWNVVILDKKADDGNILAHYIFDFSSMIKAKPIATFDNENYYHKVEGNINQASYALTDSEKAFNAITDDNPIYPSEEYRQERLYYIISNGGGPHWGHQIPIYPANKMQQGDKSVNLCKTSSYTITISSGRIPDEDMYPNDVFARFYNVPSEDNTSYVLYYALVGEE